MKKIAVAVAGALLAGSAMAANVTLYGIVDTGLVYNNSSVETKADDSSFFMGSGLTAGSRFGLKGSEDLGNGYTVSFNLQNGFTNDDGRLGQDDRLFGREAILSIAGPYGTFSFGRMGSLNSGLGTYDLFMANADVLDGGYAAAMTGFWAVRDRYDNMVTYMSPTANGFTGYAQYSLGTGVNGQDTDGGSRGKDRYASLGLNYAAGNLNVVAVADVVMKADVYGNNVRSGQDTKSLSAGVSYDFGNVKAFFGAQYGENERAIGGEDQSIATGLAGNDTVEGLADGYTLHVGAAWAVPCGTLNTALYVGDYDLTSGAATTDARMYGAVVSHVRPFSKRTYMYTAVGYKRVQSDDAAIYLDNKTVTAAVGLTHMF